MNIKVIERNERDEVAVLRGNLGESTEILKRSLAMGCVLPDLCLQDLVEFHIHRYFWSWFSVWVVLVTFVCVHLSMTFKDMLILISFLCRRKRTNLSQYHSSCVL